MFNIMLAKVASQVEIKNVDSMISDGTYVNNIFSMSGVALAMFFAVNKTKRKQFAPIIIGAASASIAAGVTEPIEFSFIFVSPAL
jgi:PTS system maltose and glucose-specific IIC component